MQISKFDIVLVNLNPTKGSEQKGIRPCLIVQNNPANAAAQTTVVCVISSVIKKYPHTMTIQPSKANQLTKKSRLDLLQIRTIDKQRIIKKIGELDQKYHDEFTERFKVSFDLENLF